MDELDWLVEYAQTGSQAAFSRLVERYIDLVYSAAARQVRDVHVAQDVSQGVFVLLARKAQTLAASRVPLAGWLIKTTRWVALNALRQQARRRKHERKAAAMTPETSDGDDGANADKIWEELMPHLDAALARLGNMDRSAVVMRYMQRRTLREVGEALGVSEDAAKQRVFRAVGKLRRLFVKGGICLPAAALTAAIAARAVEAAPVGMAPSTAAAAIGGASGAHLAGMLKGTGWIMAMTKTKVAVLGAVAFLAVATPAVVVVAHRLGGERPAAAVPPVVARPAVLGIAATAPTTLASTQPAAAVDWRARFNAAYRLGADETLRRIPRPFIAERNQYIAMVNRNGIVMPDMGMFVFHFNDGQVEWNRWTSEEATVGNVLRFVCGVPSYKLVMDDFDRMRRLDGDWVTRPGATEDDLVLSTFVVIRSSLAWPVIVEKTKIEREVFVARGKWNVTSPRPSPDQLPLLRIYLDKPGKVDNRAIGEVGGLFNALGELMATEVINEAEGTEKQSVMWCNNAASGVAAEFRAKLLAHLSEQTGLTFTLERRLRDTWVTKQE